MKKMCNLRIIITTVTEKNQNKVIYFPFLAFNFLNKKKDTNLTIITIRPSLTRYSLKKS